MYNRRPAHKSPGSLQGHVQAISHFLYATGIQALVAAVSLQPLPNPPTATLHRTSLSSRVEEQADKGKITSTSHPLRASVRETI